MRRWHLYSDFIEGGKLDPEFKYLLYVLGLYKPKFLSGMESQKPNSYGLIYKHTDELAQVMGISVFCNLLG